MIQPFLRSKLRLTSLTLACLALAGRPVAAQTDYYNTDRYRPIRIEDAYATDRYALDVHLAPVRLERSKGGVYTWEVDPEIAYGIFPRTQLELGLPLTYADLGSAGRSVGLTGLELSVLHNLNIETTGLPAFGFRATTLFPVGSLAAERAYSSLQGIMTRTFSGARFHINGEYTAGREPLADEHTEVSRWLGGVAVDRTFPLRAMLVTGEVYARQPIRGDETVDWNAGAGVRYQIDPYFAVDAGVGKRLTGDDRSWFLTFGLARVLGVRALIPGF